MEGRRSSLIVIILGTGAMFGLLSMTMVGGGMKPAFTSKDGIEYGELTCSPANKELKFGYTCLNLWEAEKIARAGARVHEMTDGQPHHLVGYAFVDETGPHSISASENPRQYLFLNFFVEEDGRLISASVDIGNRSVVGLYE